jgi:hypothetical protein
MCDGDFSLQHAITLAACSRPGFHGGWFVQVCRGLAHRRECG